jgi:hypothetical protein
LAYLALGRFTDKYINTGGRTMQHFVDLSPRLAKISK